MAGGLWSITNSAAASTAASATQVAPSNFSATGMTIRARAFSATVAAATSGAALLQLVGGGSVLKSWQMAVSSGGMDAQIVIADQDIRCNSGDSLVIAFASGTPGCAQTVNAEGDYVPVGYPAFLP